MAIPPPPPGFRMVESNIPPPPPGFTVIDGAAPAPAPRTTAEGFGRAAGLLGRDVLEGAGGLVGIFTDPFVYGAGAATGQNFAGMKDTAGQFADALGLPKPETGTERVVSDIQQAVTGGAGFLGGARKLVGAASPLVSSVGQSMAAQPTLQLVGSATGAGSGGIVREAGGSEGAQAGASILGALAPSVGVAAASETTRRVIRGGEAGRQQMARNIGDFAAAGTSPTIGQASPGNGAKILEAGIRRAPGGVGVMGRQIEAQDARVGSRVEQIAGGLSPSTGAESGGAAVVRGVKGQGGLVERTKETSERLYGLLDNLISPSARVSVANTSGAIPRINQEIPGAPSLSGLFKNSRIAGIGNALNRDLQIPTAEQAALDDALARIDSLYRSRDGAAQIGGRMQAFANDQANRADNFYPVSGAPRFPGRYSEFPDRASEGLSAADDAIGVARSKAAQAAEIEGSLNSLRDAAQAAGGRLPYEAVRKLRTLVGEEIDNATIMSDVPLSKWKALYGALSEDMRAAAVEAGPEAVRAFNRANLYTRVRIARLERVSRVIDRNGGNERVFAAVMSGANDGGTTLRNIMQSLPRNEQRDFAASVLRRMGRATPGARGSSEELAEIFSPETFLTNWNRMSTQAKSALFDRFGSGFRGDLEKIAAATSRMREAAQAMPNASGTQRADAQFVANAGLVGSAVLLEPTAFALIAGGMTASNAAARAFSNPRVVRWMAQTTRAPTAALPSFMAQLSRIGETDEDAAALYEELSQTVSQGNTQPPR